MSADGDAQEDEGEHLLESLRRLPECVGRALLLRHRLGLHGVHRLAAHEVGHLVIHVEVLNDGTPRHCDHESHHRVDEGHVRAEDAHDEDDGGDVHHGRRDEEGERHPEREPRARERDEQRDRRAGAERRHRAKQSTYDVAADALEPPQDALAALGREVALNVADDEDHHAEQNDYLDGVVDEEMYRASPLGVDVQTECAHEHGHKIRKPLHLEHLIHKVRADHFHYKSFTSITVYVIRLVYSYIEMCQCIVYESLDS